MKIKSPYGFLNKTTEPRHLFQALLLYGVKEIVGKKHSPIILGWGEEVGLGKLYTNDEIPWCGLYVAVVMKRANREVVKNPLWARNWLKFGVEANIPSLGDVLVFSRGNGGHVGFYIGEDSTTYHVLGGNQSNMVNIIRIEKSRLLGARRPPYINAPSNIKPILINNNSVISKNEA